MGKRGPKPGGRVAIAWNSNFAYALGLLATDGNLSKNGRGITFTSKDSEQIKNFMEALGVTIPIGATKSGATGKLTHRVQISDVGFHSFLCSIGIAPNKSKTIAGVHIPEEFFFDYIRGELDGDGSIYAYWDERWSSSFVCYTTFKSASEKHIEWLQHEIEKRINHRGHISRSVKSSVLQLRYGKSASVLLWQKMYASPEALCLSRKRLKTQEIMRIILERQVKRV